MVPPNSACSAASSLRTVTRSRAPRFDTGAAAAKLSTCETAGDGDLIAGMWRGWSSSSSVSESAGAASRGEEVEPCADGAIGGHPRASLW